MATVDTADKARTALQLARAALLDDVKAAAGSAWAEMPETLKLSALAHASIDDSLATTYLAALNAALP